jgi:hypothetical protein
VGGNLRWAEGEEWKESLITVDTVGDPETALGFVGFSGGVYLTLGLLDYLALQTEILFTTIGGHYGYDLLSGERLEGYHSLHVVEIPIYLKPRFRLGVGRIYLLAGPDILWRLGNPLTVTEELEDKSFIGRTSSSDFLFGVAAALGYEISLGPGMLSFELKYLRTLTGTISLFDDDDIPVFYNAAAIFVGYGFTL